MATLFYHTRDPIENLRIAVTARKISAGDERDREAAVGATWSRSYRWQEKTWPHKECDNSNRRKKNPTGSSEAGTMVLAASAEPETVSDHSGVTLCSYVDADNYEPRRSQDDPILAIFEGPAPTAFGNSSRTTTSELRDTKGTPLKSIRDCVALRVHREESFRQMHLVLRVSGREGNRGKAEELILASLQYYYHTGLLCVTPGFSVCENDPNDAERLRKGPKLTTFRITSKLNGAQFEYALDNENDLWPTESPHDQILLRELRRLDQMCEGARLDEWRNKQGSDNAGQMTQSAKQVGDSNEEQLILVEVVSVAGVEGSDPVRVSIDLLLASTHAGANDWSLAHGVPNCKTQLSKPTIKGSGQIIASFGYQAQWVIKRPNAGRERTPPTLHLRVVSEDWWGRERLFGEAEIRVPETRGFCELRVDLWRPLLPTHAQLEEFFLGRASALLENTPATAHVADKLNKTPTLSRFGSQTISSDGYVRVRITILEHRARVASSLQPSTGGGASVPADRGVVKRTVEEILQSVKAYQHSFVAEKRITLSPLSSLSDRSVHTILTKLKERGNLGASPSAS